MAITRDEVLHVAKLARLELTDAEVDRFGTQLSAILEAVGKVAELDLTDVEGTAHPAEEGFHFRLNRRGGLFPLKED